VRIDCRQILSDKKCIPPLVWTNGDYHTILCL